MAELLIGCGSRRVKALSPNGKSEWTELTTLDINADHHPDVIHDLNCLPLPFADDSFDEIHAYEVLEHCGRQGDHVYFFQQFSDLWRILRPGGYFCASVPLPASPWAWGDPSHTRVLPRQTFTFLDQYEYIRQVGVTGITDFRYLYKADLRMVFAEEAADSLYFVLQAVKPSRCPPELL